MRIENVEVLIARATLAAGLELGELVEARLEDEVLRWHVSRVDRHEITVEATVVRDGFRRIPEELVGASSPGRSAVVNIIPTGVGCEVGGYAGDASPATRLLSACADYVITNPNALNASDFIGALDRVLYTEGYCIDLFSKGLVDLWLPRANKVGLIIEKADEWMLDTVFNVVNTARAVHGVDIVDCVVTEEPMGTRCEPHPSGAYAGTVANPLALFKACERLLAAGATALAITTNIQGLPGEEYVQHFQGQHPNPMGGVEAVLSHLVVSRYSVPAAHAPMINLKGAGPTRGGQATQPEVKRLRLVRGVVDARGAGEMVSASGLACVLVGLARAPQLSEHAGCRYVDRIGLGNVAAVVAPASALGGIPVLQAHQRSIPVVAVRSNRTVLDVTASQLGLSGVIEVDNYTEAAGVVLALQEGISLESLYRPLKTLDYQAPATEELEAVSASAM